MTEKEDQKPLVPKPFTKGDIVKINNGIYSGQEGEVYGDRYHRKTIQFQVIIDGRNLQRINQDYLSSK